MNVLQEILRWSAGRPNWQRDALRRLVENDELIDDDLDELTEICKAGKGLSEKKETLLLTEEHLPAEAGSTDKVAVQSLHHLQGVNALAEDQTLHFGPGLTVVYGDNAAGKSGYTRILKRAFRARGAEDVLGNVVSGTAPPAMTVSIKYKVGENGDDKEWTGEEEDDALSRVSVFDTHSASVYLKEKTDVAFRPFGLDLFDKLSQACSGIRTRLERERGALQGAALAPLPLPVGTQVAELLSNITSLTNPDTVTELAALSEEETQRMESLEKQLSDLFANDPARLAQELTLRAGRLRSFKSHVEEIERVLSDESVEALAQARADLDAKTTAAQQLRTETFSPDLLPGTGSDSWSALWEGARAYSEAQAYPDRPFPVTEADASCVLCQQELQPDAEIRLRRFEEFVTSTAEQELRTARRDFDQKKAALLGLALRDDATDEHLGDVRIEDEQLADGILALLEAATTRQNAVRERLDSGNELLPGLVGLTVASERLGVLADQLQERATALSTQGTAEQRDALNAELNELKARKILANNLEAVLAEIERRKRIAAYGLCLDETRTQSITTKSTAVTKEAVTDKLRESFAEELTRINFRHVEVEIREVGGERGILYHKLKLSRAPGYELEKIVSEGEARALSIAAFFAELSTADDPSAIIFDDPVSSLDYKWRRNVARRLVEEAKARQVIVFTHDIVFLLALKEMAQEAQIEYLDQHVRQMAIGAGVCDEDLPWVALPVRKRIGVLRNMWQSADKTLRDGHQKAYEQQAIMIYGLLREAWERGLEEVLLGGVVERYRSGVQTRQIGTISDITPEDCQALEQGMTKTSKWLPGHDQAAAAREDVPEPEELAEDINALDTWVTAINGRRR